MTPHTFRHVFITVNRVDLGADSDLVKRLVGHADDNISAVYTDSVLSAKRKLQERYEAYLRLPDYFLSHDDTNYSGISSDIFNENESSEISSIQSLDKVSLDDSSITEKIHATLSVEDRKDGAAARI